MMKFHDDENTAALQGRLALVTVVILVFFFVIAARLFHLQILHGAKYRGLATETFVREEEVVARRGDILDRNGLKLADTRPYFEITLTPQYVDDRDRVVGDLIGLFPSLDPDDVAKRLADARAEPRFMPVAVAGDVPFDWAAKLRERLLPEYSPDSPVNLNGVALRVTPIRRYLYPELFSHALGYLREVDRAGLDKLSTDHPGVYSRGDLVGAAGVEKSYDIELKGRDGVNGRVVDARGREAAQIDDVKILQEGGTIAPVAGYHLRTALDFDAQKAAQAPFLDRDGQVVKKGAVVAIDPENGEVIAMYSSPGFDANRVMKNADPAYWKKINLDEDKYLFNRAVQAMYPPASTYKPIGVAAGIASGTVDPLTTKFTCRGGLSFGNRFFKCWHAGHGTLDVVHGLAQSCDVFFYNVGIKTGVDTLAKYARLFGYGSPTGIDVPFERGGLVPTKEWKKARYGQDWIDSETLSVAIGQSYNLATPLQMAKMAAMVANGGYAVTPHLAQAILNPDGSVARGIAFPKVATELAGSDAVAWAKKGMIEVVQGAGTATRLRASPYKIAGKTGTAQVIGHESKARRTKDTVNHGLFIGFAPHDDPKIAVSVIVENGGSGSGAAAPVAMSVIDAYLGKIMPIPKKEPAPKPSLRKKGGRR
jgi:penicillin-binding protein 2